MLREFSKYSVYVISWGPHQICNRSELAKGGIAFNHKKDDRHLSVIICRISSWGKEHLFVWHLCSSQHRVLIHDREGQALPSVKQTTMVISRSDWADTSCSTCAHPLSTLTQNKHEENVSGVIFIPPSCNPAHRAAKLKKIVFRNLDIFIGTSKFGWLIDWLIDFHLITELKADMCTKVWLLLVISVPKMD